jgi:beta-aspartyl-dipeptidase (metallo-type)
MVKVLKNLEIYTPHQLEKKHLLIANGMIEDIFEEENKYKCIPTEEMKGMYAFPGFIDGHVHVIGGGGEAGFTSRVEEIKTKKLLKCGVTGVIGLLGTDSITRSLNSLFAKVMALRKDGIDAYMLSGSYSYPVKTITGTIEKDMVLIDPVIGVGELAISDARSSVVSVEELQRMAHEVYVSSMLAGKNGRIIVHVGKSPTKLDPLFEAVKDGEISMNLFLPTHVNRSYELLEEAAKWANKGGYVDLTACLPNGSMVCVKDAMKFLLDKGVNLDHILVSSDAQGSLPSFGDGGKLLSIKVSECTVLLDSFKECVKDGMSIENALKPFTSNVADFFAFNTGRIEEGRKANIIFLDQKLALKKVMLKGEFRDLGGND